MSYLPALLMFRGDLELDPLFEDHGVSWLVIQDMFALKWATYRRCFLAGPPLSARQRFNRQECAHLLQNLVAAGALPHRSAHFSLRGLGFHSTPARWPNCQRQSQDSSPDASSHSAPTLHTGWTILRIVAEEYRFLEVLHYELAAPTPAAWIEVFEPRHSLWREQQLQLSDSPHISLAPPDLLAHGAHVIAEAYVQDHPFAANSLDPLCRRDRRECPHRSSAESPCPLRMRHGKERSAVSQPRSMLSLSGPRLDLSCHCAETNRSWKYVLPDQFVLFAPTPCLISPNLY